MEQKADIEQLLREGNTVQVGAEGYSMYPLLVPGRDQVILVPCQGGDFAREKNKSCRIRRGDVVLYRRDQGILVLHRVFAAGKEGLYFVGDNQTQVEGPLRYDQVRGKMAGFIRKGKEISVTNPVYRIYSGLWLCLRPVRHSIAAGIHALKAWK